MSHCTHLPALIAIPFYVHMSHCLSTSTCGSVCLPAPVSPCLLSTCNYCLAYLSASVLLCLSTCICLHVPVYLHLFHCICITVPVSLHLYTCLILPLPVYLFHRSCSTAPVSLLPVPKCYLHFTALSDWMLAVHFQPVKISLNICQECSSHMKVTNRCFDCRWSDSMLLLCIVC